MDYIDAHGYWQHPHFPRRPWDPVDWTIGRKAMVDHPEQAIYPRIAAGRVPGRPFTVSEYNHPAPNDFQVECVPMFAAVAAREDWDGVWFYTYEHSNKRWDRAAIPGFFNFRADPAKWAFMPIGAALFRDGGIPAEPDTFLSSLHMGELNAATADPSAALRRFEVRSRGMGKSAKELAALMYRNVETPSEPPKRPFFLMSGVAGGVAIGHGADFEGWTAGRIRVAEPAFCAVAIAAMDGMSMNTSRRLLVVGCGRAENTGMQFNKSRTSVGANWGGPPVRAEAVRGDLRLPPGNWRAWALKPDGTRAAQVPLHHDPATRTTILPMSPEHGTICYWLER
jgi:hypothetical protein